jgi:hypothetical protein
MQDVPTILSIQDGVALREHADATFDESEVKMRTGLDDG